MWRYEISTGKLSRDGTPFSEGYSGRDAGKNNPAMQHARDVGPIPVGHYAIGEKYDSEGHGPVVMRLTPHAGTQLHGRSGFLIHGDSIGHPGTASHGCIILPRAVRLAIAASGDRELEVVAGAQT